MQRVTQNSCQTSACNGLVYHRMADVRRLHWRPSSLVLCSGQGQLEQDAQDCVQSGFQHIQGWRVRNIGEQPVPGLVYLHCKKSVCLCSDRICCVSFCAHCLLPCHWAPLKRAWLCFLCTLSAGICIH